MVETSWIKIDDAFLDHPKFLEAGPLAGYLNVCAIAWSNRNLTDGVIPRAQVPRLVNWEGLADPLELAALLVEFGLWEEGPGCFQIHDYLAHQRSAAQIREDRDKNAVRQARFRNASPNAVSNAPRNGVTNGSVTGAKKLEVEVETETPTSTPSRPRSAADVESSPQTVALCDLLSSLIVGNDAKANPSSTSKAWRDSARLLLEKDGRDFDEAQRVIRWCQADDFWRSNILSMPKLREKYPQLLLRMSNGKAAPLEQTSKVGRDKWRTWADQNVPDLPVAYAGAAADSIAYAGQQVTADAVRARVAAMTFDLDEVSS